MKMTLDVIIQKHIYIYIWLKSDLCGEKLSVKLVKLTLYTQQLIMYMSYRWQDEKRPLRFGWVFNHDQNRFRKRRSCIHTRIHWKCMCRTNGNTLCTCIYIYMYTKLPSWMALIRWNTQIDEGLVNRFSKFLSIGISHAYVHCVHL